MNVLMKFSLLGAALVLIVWGWFSFTGAHKSQRCDHQNPTTVEVNIVGMREGDTEGAPGKLKSVPPTIIACNGDDIAFTAENLESEFEILFKPDENPFEKKNPKSSNGKVQEAVVINPTRRRGAVFIKYDVKAEGYDLLDPKIIITPR